jgi:uncharacterized protein (TIGR03067 family)
MRRLLTLGLFAATALGLAALGSGCAGPTAAHAPTAEALDGDAKKLQGVWVVETLEDGKTEKLTGEARAAALERIKEVRLVFDGDQLTIAERGEEDPVTFRLDPARAPKVVTLYPERQEPVYRTAPRGPTARSGGGWGRGGYATTAARPRDWGTAKAAGTYRSTAPFTATFPGTAKGFGTAPAPGDRTAGEWTWIYKLDGDTLTVAFSKDDRRSAPADFRPRGEYPSVTVLTLKRVTAPDSDKKPE